MIHGVSKAEKKRKKEKLKNTTAKTALIFFAITSIVGL